MREIEQKNKIYEVEREKNFQVVVSDRTLLWQQKLRILKDLTPPPPPRGGVDKKGGF